MERDRWPWNMAPADCLDWDEATWHAVRYATDGELPRQSLRRWALEQRVRRSRGCVA
jgi:hypothetical protein